jgi:hypothetical protein
MPQMEYSACLSPCADGRVVWLCSKPNTQPEKSQPVTDLQRCFRDFFACCASFDAYVLQPSEHEPEESWSMRPGLSSSPLDSAAEHNMRSANEGFNTASIGCTRETFVSMSSCITRAMPVYALQYPNNWLLTNIGLEGLPVGGCNLQMPLTTTRLYPSPTWE